MSTKKSAAEAPQDYVWLVYDWEPCPDGCGHGGKTNIAVYLDERKQAAHQEAERRSKQYGGYSGSPHMHIERVPISTTVQKSLY